VKQNAGSGRDDLNTDSCDVTCLNEYFTGIATDPNYDIAAPIQYNDSTSDLKIGTYSLFSRIRHHASTLKIKKTSPGLDNIPTGFTKLAAPIWRPSLLHSSTKYSRPATLPAKWKHAVITPLPKVSQPKEPSDFRPISVTPLISRLFERALVRKHILQACRRNYLLTSLPSNPPAPHRGFGEHVPSCL